MIGPIRPDRFLSATIAEVSLPELDSALGQVLARIAPDGFVRSSGALCIGDLYDREPPAGGAHAKYLVLFAPVCAPSNSVLLTNLQDGWESVSDLVARTHGRLQLQVRSTVDPTEYPQNMFRVHRDGSHARTVMSMRDSNRWVFIEQGTVEAFEELDLYLRRLKRERLSRAVLLRYAARLGWDLTQPAFWEASADAIHYQQLPK